MLPIYHSLRVNGCRRTLLRVDLLRQSCMLFTTSSSSNQHSELMHFLNGRNIFQRYCQCPKTTSRTTAMLSEHCRRFASGREVQTDDGAFFVREGAKKRDTIQRKYRKTLDPSKIGQGKGKKIVNIKKEMKIEDLATAMDVDNDHVYEALLIRKDSDDFDFEPHTVLKEPVIIDVIKKSGMLYQYAKLKEDKPRKNKDVFKRPPADPDDMVSRPAVVTVMGHVDHGKTSLLDTLRKTSVAAGEAGGITQHIGAFSVKLPSMEVITFLDTPGHAAFSAMRARGAHVTDIVVLVVAADDGVMGQTIESIHHATHSQVPIIVAINKIDKSDADPDFTKKDLLAHGVHIEELGGDIQAVEISAVQGTNVDVLTEAIAAQAEMMELKADVKGFVEGTILESRLDKGQGPIATVLVQRGTLKKGCVLVAGTSRCKVRGMFNEHRQPLKIALPSTPVEITGWKGLPSAGEEMLQVETEKKAKEVTDWRIVEKKEKLLSEEKEIIQLKAEEQKAAHTQKMMERSKLHWKEYHRLQVDKNKKLMEEQKDRNDPVLNVILKGDVDGSMEALLNMFHTYNCHDLCDLQLAHWGVGMVTIKDIEMAQMFNGIVYGFNVTVHPEAQILARKEGVTIKLHKVIYKLLDDLKDDLSSKLPLKEEYEVIGEANLLQVFTVTDGKKKRTVAGCRVTKGNLLKNGYYKVNRRNSTILTGSLTSMRHLKDEVNTITKGMECGLSFDQYETLQPGDTVQCCEIKQIPQKISWDPGF
ncbi:translation initiation factor IF-2, mitochondrial-like [Saccoglossus kowalevskii]|uniref:Translation initiation factor IF-2, mitochondrial n=1 Tax=Saccoglossus kowalevskii TaxID=10224 RepID=A0ABM0GMT1_SACKO|nr:PREDICTED: translation initiation factor IF-2, mitochondrial-like [Saccoglossus kowalevskii]